MLIERLEMYISGSPEHLKGKGYRPAGMSCSLFIIVFSSQYWVVVVDS
jgi:hypothetical protein